MPLCPCIRCQIPRESSPHALFYTDLALHSRCPVAAKGVKHNYSIRKDWHAASCGLAQTRNVSMPERGSSGPPHRDDAERKYHPQGPRAALWESGQKQDCFQSRSGGQPEDRLKGSIISVRNDLTDIRIANTKKMLHFYTDYEVDFTK